MDETKKTILKLLLVCVLCVGLVSGLVLLVQSFN
jgi:hypothetical protein